MSTLTILLSAFALSVVALLVFIRTQRSGLVDHGCLHRPRWVATESLP